MFSDIRGFTALVESAAARGDDRAAQHLLHADVRCDQRQGGVVNQMIGDGLMAMFGAPLPLADHSAAARWPRSR